MSNRTNNSDIVYIRSVSGGPAPVMTVFRERMCGMKYIEITIETSAAGIEPAAAKLGAIGIDDIEVTDPRDIEDIMEHKESYEWDYINDEVVEQMKETPKIQVFCADDEEGREKTEAVRRAMQELADACGRGEYGPGVDFGSLFVTAEVKDDAEWKDKWKEYFKPFRVSEHLVIRPSWEEYEAGPEDTVIEIDPGMAFGTGTHETTSMCIQMIDQYLKPGSRVLDAGCGSGILAIAAAKLGAAEVLGVDIDREAVRVARENFQKNHVEDICRAEYGDLTRGVDFKADLIAGNLMAELICMLADGVYAHLAEEGLFIASGILTEKEQMVTEALQAAGFRIVESRTKGEWCALAAARPRG